MKTIVWSAKGRSILSLYRKLGYTECGRLEHFTYKPDRWYDDIRMEKWL